MASLGRVRYPAESGTAFTLTLQRASYRDATGTNAMTEPATIGRPSVSKTTSCS